MRRRSNKKFPNTENCKLNSLFDWKDLFSIAVYWSKVEWMFKQYNPLLCGGVSILSDETIRCCESGSLSVWLLTRHAGIDYLPWFNLPPLFPCPAPLNLTDSEKQWQLYQPAQHTPAAERVKRKEGTQNESRRDKDRNARRGQMKKEHVCVQTVLQLDWNDNSNITWILLINIKLCKMSMRKSTKPKWVWKQAVWEVTLSTVCACLLVTWARWFCQAVRAERVRETTFATVLLL